MCCHTILAVVARSLGVLNVQISQRSLPISYFDIQNNPNGAVKLLYSSAKCSSDSLSGDLNLKEPKNSIRGNDI